MRFGPVTVTRGEYAKALEELHHVLGHASSTEEKIDFVRSRFRFFEIYGGKQWGEILLTSYFEPIISGSTVRTSSHSHPLYAKPTDLVTIDLKQFSERFKGENALKGRLHDGKVLPYYTREEIDGGGVLKGRRLELCWVDLIEAFFLHIQGSGTVRLEDGSEVFITYADKNGRKYEAIGKFLKERIAPKKITMQRVEAALREMPEHERNELLYRNPSYVFFNKSPQRAITALGVPATPGRTIAADPKYAPKGALALLSFSKPVLSDESEDTGDPLREVEITRLVLDQDSGGAITGTDRVDLFWGRGDEAKCYAGIIQHPARIVYLVPR
jgi:membrane-bound lytic murein transglycosylase A